MFLAGSLSQSMSNGRMPLKLFKRQALAIGALLTLLQLALAFCLSPNHRPAEVYSRLCAWDCGWYTSIARDGYHSPVPPTPQKVDTSNVAFFPGFPYLARAAHLGLGIKTETALVVIAQIFAVLFWAALWSILRAWRISIQGSILVILAVLAHPAAFFLIAGYSESLFLSTLLIFILSSRKLSTRPASPPSIANALSGVMMSATRIVGIPVSFFPLMARISTQAVRRKVPSLKGISAATATSLISSLVAFMGAAGFLIYCQLRFGRYDLYMETQRIGWGIQPDYAAVFKWKDFAYTLGFDKGATILSGISFVLFAGIEGLLLIAKRNRGFTDRLPLYTVSLLIFFITVSGLKSLNFRSMIRYTLPWHILLLLCLAHLISRNFRQSPRILNLCLGLGVIGAAISIRLLGAPHITDFLSGGWFA
jgi:hypothetical protein